MGFDWGGKRAVRSEGRGLLALFLCQSCALEGWGQGKPGLEGVGA